MENNMKLKLLILLLLIGCTEDNCQSVRKELYEREEEVRDLKQNQNIIFDQTVVGKCYKRIYKNKEDQKFNYALKITGITSKYYNASRFSKVIDISNGKTVLFLNKGHDWEPSDFYLLKEITCKEAIEFTKNNKE